MKRWTAVAAVWVPLAVMAGWIGYHYAMRGAPVVRLAIEGYDPRDLLSGHYLIYRIHYGERGNCGNVSASSASELCLCLDQASPARASWLGRCEHKPRDCSLYLKGKCSGSRFEAGIERFYFPESYQGQLKTVPPDSSIDVRIAEGRGQVAELYIRGIPWREALSQKQ